MMENVEILRLLSNKSIDAIEDDPNKYPRFTQKVSE